jgi:hypothetical protein
MSTDAWELIFMMLVLKLPILYLIGVVVWAIRATPDPFAAVALEPSPSEPPQDACPWRGRQHRTRPRPPAHRRRAATVGAR